MREIKYDFASGHVAALGTEGCIKLFDLERNFRITRTVRRAWQGRVAGGMLPQLSRAGRGEMDNGLRWRQAPSSACKVWRLRRRRGTAADLGPAGLGFCGSARLRDGTLCKFSCPGAL